ncbi:MAG: hypothetical protein A2W91_11790 [Bacteroidetes bacterium GWF2_38_335]|nr:MAG: hypothetical protein A2W91_11790 [Bacteroidetes bacterium GWF2_38_335]OFY77961.1 MAG: hypothetical protein A2281_18535 [Bacteroidetes bacterium RIFOXYA12_FULL_38_20]HBS86702.1 hypothetical protein [Bacteroidales bacterium]
MFFKSFKPRIEIRGYDWATPSEFLLHNNLNPNPYTPNSPFHFRRNGVLVFNRLRPAVFHCIIIPGALPRAELTWPFRPFAHQNLRTFTHHL